MRNNDPISIKDACNQAINNSPHKSKIFEAKVVSAWKKIMPASVINKTDRIFLKNDSLFVQVTSAVLKHSLQVNEGSILKLLEEENLGIRINKVVIL